MRFTSLLIAVEIRPDAESGLKSDQGSWVNYSRLGALNLI
jgi:hypothetical protein